MIRFILLAVASLKMLIPWGGICFGVFFLADNNKTGSCFVAITLGLLILIDIYLMEYCKK